MIKMAKKCETVKLKNYNNNKVSDHDVMFW